MCGLLSPGFTPGTASTLRWRPLPGVNRLLPLLLDRQRDVRPLQRASLFPRAWKSSAFGLLQLLSVQPSCWIFWLLLQHAFVLVVVPSGRPGPGSAVHFGLASLAARRFDGEYRDEVSPGLPHYRNTFYICLRGARGGAPFWTNNYASYVARTRDSVGGRDFDDSAISHAFPTRAEVSAYLAGARQGWPQEI